MGAYFSQDVNEVVELNIANMSRLREKLGMPFLQLHDNFGPRDFERVVAFVKNWKYPVPLAIRLKIVRKLIAKMESKKTWQ